MGRRVVAGRRIGDLESAILDVLWSASGWLSGREILERLGGESKAYTTVLTVLGRLVEKSLVERAEAGRAFVYRAAGDPDELTAQAIRELLAASAHPRAALAHFVAGLDDPDLIAELSSALRRSGRG
jgi:predicted transcriptional regulator